MVRSRFYLFVASFYIVAFMCWWVFVKGPLFGKEINLGLDLKGGTNIVLQVDIEKSLRTQIKSTLTTVLTNEEIEKLDWENSQFSLNLFESQSRNSEQIEWGELGIVRMENDGKIIYRMAHKNEIEFRKKIVENTIEAIKNRVDALGVLEPYIAQRGEDSIVVQLPGLKDPKEAKKLLSQTAHMEFNFIIDENSSTLTQWTAENFGEDYFKLSPKKFKELVNAKLQIIKEKFGDGIRLVAGETFGKSDEIDVYIVEDKVSLFGSDIEDAFVSFDESNRPNVGLKLTQEGALRFSELTHPKNKGRQFAVLLDGQLMSVMEVGEHVTTPDASITLGGNSNNEELMKDAMYLSKVLRAGALPAEIQITEERTIGPSLGKDSIEKGKAAVLISFVLIILFLFYYYSKSGLVAIVSLSFNLFLLVILLIVIGSTLTLPGIAGIALTVGLSVDANIIIFERIKEEICKGIEIKQAVEAGLSRAFPSIFDANATTFLTSCILAYFSSGPVRGFAVTLVLGLVSTMIASLFGTGSMLLYFSDIKLIKDGRKFFRIKESISN